ncbi:MAG TPA: DUF3488 domain-containing protein, partial [Burkholderiaceae bacterium]
VQQLRSVWEAANNYWNQWVLNYTQSRQLDLMKSLGFDSPSREDLVRMLGVLVAAAALLGALWALWDRRRHDPWLRLLERARARLRQAGLALPANSPPRTMAVQARQHFGSQAQPLADWLLRLEHLRYASAHSGKPASSLPALRRDFARLHWPS